MNNSKSARVLHAPASKEVGFFRAVSHRILLVGFYRVVIGYYQKNSKGSIYKHTLRQLSFGILGIIVINVVMQVILTLSERLSRLQLTPVLIIIYALIALYACGFVLIALGAKNLRKFEEV